MAGPYHGQTTPGPVSGPVRSVILVSCRSCRMREDLCLSRNRFQLSPVSSPFCPPEISFTSRLVAFFPGQILQNVLSLTPLCFSSDFSALSHTLFFFTSHYFALPLVFCCLSLILQPPLFVPLRQRVSHRGSSEGVGSVPAQGAAWLSWCLWVSDGCNRVQPLQLCPRARIWCIRGGDQPLYAQRSHILKCI